MSDRKIIQNKQNNFNTVEPSLRNRQNLTLVINQSYIVSVDRLIYCRTLI